MVSPVNQVKRVEIQAQKSARRRGSSTWKPQPDPARKVAGALRWAYEILVMDSPVYFPENHGC
jgi:hypothetical protein